MKNLKFSFAFGALIALTMACSPRSSEEKSQSNPADSPESIGSATLPVQFKKESTTAIFNSYLELKDALVETDADKASAEAKKLEAQLTEAKYSPIKAEVNKISESTDPAIQREAFDGLSEQMIALAKDSELVSGNLFLQHCPMASGNKGANWLSLSEEIRNPYFGDRMLKCGSVTEKL